MKLSSAKRERSNTNSVMEEKSALLFMSLIQIGSLSIQVWEMSLPNVVIVHSDQNVLATATILWDNAFSIKNRQYFTVPTKVKWNSLATALNLKFTSVTGRELTEVNLSYLRKCV